MPEQEKKILSKFEWFLLLFALGILAVVMLQNQGIHPVETVEHTKVGKIKDQESYKRNTTYGAKKNSKGRLSSLSDYFSENRAAAKANGKDTGFNWSSLKMAKDEKAYLKNKYGEPVEKEPSRDWLTAISDSYNTYKSVKSTFEELGIDADKIINVENASRALSNPIKRQNTFYTTPTNMPLTVLQKKMGDKINCRPFFISVHPIQLHT